MAYLKYSTEFYSENDYDNQNYGGRWKLNIWKKTGSGGGGTFHTTSEGFVLSMDGSDDGILAPIKTTSVSFNFIIEEGSTGQAEILDDLLSVATNNEGDLALEIQRAINSSGDFKRYWIGTILGDLSAGKDTTPNRIVTIKAVDGLSQLKYKNFDNDTYGGTVSCMQLIKSCLNEISTADSDWAFWSETDANKKNFIAHTPYYYNKAMAGTGSLDSTWKEDVNHDPLSLVKINTHVFKDKNGQPWSYYKILEQILAAFQLRIMMCSHRNDTGSSLMEFGNALWYIQAPLLFHNNSNDSDYDNDQLIFYHSIDYNTGIALSYDSNFVADDNDPEQKLSGTQEHYIPSLLSYKSIYNHSIFNALVCGPNNFNSAYPLYGSGNYNYYDDLTGFNIDAELTNEMSWEQAGLLGWTNQHQNSGVQRLVVVGNVTIKPIDAVYYADNDAGYLSGQEYWAEYVEDPYWGIYTAYDTDAMVFPRMGMFIRCSYRTPDGSYDTAGFALCDWRRCMLYGSVPWDSDSTFLSYETEQSDNYAGFNGTYTGLRFDLSDFESGDMSSVLTDGDGNIYWGQDPGPDMGGDDMADPQYFWRETFDFVEYGIDNTINQNTGWAWFSPAYFEGENAVINYGSSWDYDANLWQQYCNDGTFTQTQPFMITTPPIPWCRQDDTAPYDRCLLADVAMVWGVPRDKVFSSSGDGFYACNKDWTRNRQLQCVDRGIHYSYEYSDIRVFLTGTTFGGDSFDQTFGWFENANGTPSEELVQEPEIIIGDQPMFDPFADPDNSESWGGEYIGLMMIYLTADSNEMAETGLSTGKWRTEAMGTSSTEDSNLHELRAKMALAHYYQIKRKLNLTFLDRSSNRTIESCPFAQLYRWSSGDWEVNQAGADIAFMPTGGKFVAGTGKFTVTLEDCVTYSKDNLTNKTYSSNG
tara:strand:- start:1340 stop:4105 length:2766 start_codon:yes stop_codon:yes gene_type:complete